MKGAIVVVVLVLLVAGFCGYHKNPQACQKLGLDLVKNIRAVYTDPVDSTPPPAPAIPAAKPSDASPK